MAKVFIGDRLKVVSNFTGIDFFEIGVPICSNTVASLDIFDYEHFIGQVKSIVQGDPGKMPARELIQIDGGPVISSFLTTRGAGLLAVTNDKVRVFPGEVIEGYPELSGLNLDATLRDFKSSLKLVILGASLDFGVIALPAIICFPGVAHLDHSYAFAIHDEFYSL